MVLEKNHRKTREDGIEKPIVYMCTLIHKKSKYA